MLNALEVSTASQPKQRDERPDCFERYKSPECRYRTPRPAPILYLQQKRLQTQDSEACKLNRSKGARFAATAATKSARSGSAMLRIPDWLNPLMCSRSRLNG